MGFLLFYFITITNKRE